MKKVLVLCSGNSCRSQMSEGYLKYYGGNRAQIYSAGLENKDINPFTTRVMGEDSIDISKHTSNSYKDFSKIKFDYLITVCKESDKKVPRSIRAKSKIHFDIPDPDAFEGSPEEKLRFFRKVRETIKVNMLRFIGQHLAEKEKSTIS